jgi:hypothetical protein
MIGNLPGHMLSTKTKNLQPRTMLEKLPTQVITSGLTEHP